MQASLAMPRVQGQIYAQQRLFSIGRSDTIPLAKLVFVTVCNFYRAVTRKLPYYGPLGGFAPLELVAF